MVSVKGEGEAVRRTPVGAGRGLGPGGQVRKMFRGLLRRLRGNHERRVRHSVFTQLRRVSIPPRAPQLNCSTGKCALGSHVRLHAPGLSTAKRPPGDDSRRTLMVPDGPDAGPRPELSCPVSAASAAASAPTAPAGRRRPASAGRAATARGVPRRTGHAAAPARARAAGPPAAPGPARTPAAATPRRGHEHDNQYDECDQDDASDHGVTLLPFPRSGPPWALLLACVSRVQGGCPRALRTKAELSNFRGFSWGNGP